MTGSRLASTTNKTITTKTAKMARVKIILNYPKLSWDFTAIIE
jgi:hypothetical protein